MKRLAAMHDWPLLIDARLDGGLDRRVEIGARHDDERVAAAQLEHGLLELLAGGGCHLRARRASLPVSVTAAMRGSSITRATCVRADQQRLERAFGEAGAPENLFDRSAHCGTFEACLSSTTLPAISAGAAKRNTCQNGKFHGITASTGPSGW